MFKLFADLIGFHIEAHETLTRSREDLARERRDADLREQFIAVLGHDLRNPLASIEAGARLVLKAEQTEKSRSILVLMQRSVGRMSELIDNVLDFARGRLGDGIAIERDQNGSLAPTLTQVIDELRAAHPERVIVSTLSIEGTVDCDR
jgi:signal transduction histidine kinase